ncbi:MAG TPA: hypothetical protein VFO65_08905, partial [Acidimicrobiales bacterium]|nr:hypothetical protein [Acidimicrobiales bacterium]
MAGLLAGGLTFLVVPVGPAFADHDHGRGAGHQAERAAGPRADEAAVDWPAVPAGGTPGAATGAATAAATALTEDTDANDGGTPDNVADAGDDQHPSGRDRSVEPGGSGNQGRSPSDPDAGGNGGADKPGGPGGDDLADQDGNNGCGNDDDFEDDNNGNCRKRSPTPAGDSGGQPGGGQPGGGGQPAV